MNLDNLYKKINEKGFTLKEVSEAAGVSTGLLSEWKNGNRKPSVASLEKVADFLGCSIDYLIGKTDVSNLCPVNNSGTEKKILTKGVKEVCGRNKL